MKSNLNDNFSIKISGNDKFIRTNFTSGNVYIGDTAIYPGPNLLNNKNSLLI